MKPILLAVGLAAALPSPAVAQSYPIDCAILLCLAGGWPASEPCARAKVEFVRRITPWPVEPPLQLWRCPMGGSAGLDPGIPLRERLFKVATPSAPERADIDVSGSGFDFIRDLKVWQIDYRQFENRSGCKRTDDSGLGTYGPQGEFTWSNISARSAPASSGVQVPRHCQSYRWRAVRVEWRDQAGTPGFEEVRY